MKRVSPTINRETEIITERPTRGRLWYAHKAGFAGLKPKTKWAAAASVRAQRRARAALPFVTEGGRSEPAPVTAPATTARAAKEITTPTANGNLRRGMGRG